MTAQSGALRIVWIHRAITPASTVVLFQFVVQSVHFAHDLGRKIGCIPGAIISRRVRECVLVVQVGVQAPTHVVILSVRTTLPGVPITTEFAGMMVPSFRKVWPAIMQFSPMTQPSMMVELMPIRQLSPIEQPWIVQ